MTIVQNAKCKFHLSAKVEEAAAVPSNTKSADAKPEGEHIFEIVNQIYGILFLEYVSFL